MKTITMTVFLTALLFFSTGSDIMAIEVGNEAPDFSVQSTSGEISLSDYRGKKNVVLALYFLINTPV